MKKCCLFCNKKILLIIIIIIILYLTFSFYSFYQSPALLTVKFARKYRCLYYSCNAEILDVNNLQCFILGTLIEGQPIINLPPKTIHLKKVAFSAEERAFYNRLEAVSRSQFKVPFYFPVHVY